MSDTPNPHDPAEPDDGGDHLPERPARRGRRAWRITLICVISVFAVLCATAVGGYLTINHIVGNVRRIPDAFAGLNAADRPIMPAAYRRSMTILLTSSDVPLTGRGADRSPTGMVILLHLNANGRSGAVVSLAPNAVVAIPGHGTGLLGTAPTLGGPPLLIHAVENLTRVRINHYSVLDFTHTVNLINALGGVDVAVPEVTTVDNITLHPGLNHLNGIDAVYYVRQPNNPTGQAGRVLRQEAVLRNIIDKIGRLHLLSNPVSFYYVLNAFTQALSVDSNFGDAQLTHLAMQMRYLSGRSGTYLTAPTRPVRTASGQHAVVFARPASTELWWAIRHDAVAAFARSHPGTITPVAPR